MSASSQNPSSASPANPQVTAVDPLDLLDFSDYDGLRYQSPSMSPATEAKAQFARPSAAPVAAPIMPSGQSLTGPSHQYDRYKQQTPFVPGALANTMAINQNSQHVGYNLEYMHPSPNNDIFDFNTAPSQASPDMDMDFESPDAPFFFQDQSTMNHNAIGGREAQAMSPPPAFPSNVGRMYPGMHQQAALAKAQQQQAQQQRIIQQQQQQRQSPHNKMPKQKNGQPSDPIVEQKITQLLNSMRAKSGADEGLDSPLLNISRPKKDEDEMDEDERLLASEEGKKLSSKERRQLRNKVSARAFRSRRKEYITQLESEIANAVSENSDLRAHNRALLDENKRLGDLTRTLLSSPAFAGFLDNLSTNPAALHQQQQQQAQPQQQQQPQVKHEARQMPKDVNPYAAAQQAQQQQMGLPMMPEQSMDFSMLNIDSSDAFQYQPQVFTVEVDVPEMPELDTAVLSGKSTSSASEHFECNDAKVEMPALLKDAKAQMPESHTASTTSETKADLDADIFDDEEPSQSLVQSFGGVASDKAFTQYELVVVDASNSSESKAAQALMRVQRISASLEATMARLERVTIDL